MSIESKCPGTLPLSFFIPHGWPYGNSQWGRQDFSAAVGSGIFPLGDYSSFGKPGKKLSREDALLMTCATRIPCNLTNPSDRGSSWSSLLAPSHQCHPYCSWHFDAVRDNHYCYNEHAVSAGTSLNRAIALVALSQILWIEIRGYRSACNLRSA